MRKLIFSALTGGLLIFASQGAFGHAELEKSTPSANSILTTSPKFIQLEFGEALTTLKGKSANTITLLNPAGMKVATSAISINKGVARVNIAAKLKPGLYTVQYRVVSADGHVLKSEFKFRIR